MRYPRSHTPAEQTAGSIEDRGHGLGTAQAYHTTSSRARASPVPSERTRVGGDMYRSSLGFCSALAAGAAHEGAIVDASLERAVNCARSLAAALRRSVVVGVCVGLSAGGLASGGQRFRPCNQLGIEYG